LPLHTSSLCERENLSTPIDFHLGHTPAGFGIKEVQNQLQLPLHMLAACAHHGDSDGGPLPQIRSVQLGDGHVKAVLNLLDHTLDHLPFILEGCGSGDVYFHSQGTHQHVSSSYHASS